MPRILDRVPIAVRDGLISVPRGVAHIKAYEILIWVSLGPKKSGGKWEPGLPRFPAILDTAHTHNFSIQEQHLLQWVRLQPGMLDLLGNIRHAGRRLPLHAANVWIHRNEPGQRDRFLDRAPHLLELPRGIAVYPREAGFPRLPLLGLRALLTNRLHLTLDGERSCASLRTPRRFWFFG
jgi:hypothetical protein